MGVLSTFSPDGQELTISIRGRFEFGVYREFRLAYSAGTTKTHYRIDLSGVEYMDSAALGMLLLLRDHAGGDQASIILKGYCEQVRKVLEISRFNELFTLQSSVLHG